MPSKINHYSLPSPWQIRVLDRFQSPDVLVYPRRWPSCLVLTLGSNCSCSSTKSITQFSVILFSSKRGRSSHANPEVSFQLESASIYSAAQVYEYLKVNLEIRKILISRRSRSSGLIRFEVNTQTAKLNCFSHARLFNATRLNYFILNHMAYLNN